MSTKTDDRCGMRVLAPLDGAPVARPTPVTLMVEGLQRLGPRRGLARVVSLALRAVTNGSVQADGASVVLRVGNRLTTAAASTALARSADQVQYEHGGPCVDALACQASSVHTDDLHVDARWPSLTAAARERMGFASIVSYRLRAGSATPLGVLNVYGFGPDAFSEHAVTAGLHLADYLAVVLARAHSEPLPNLASWQRNEFGKHRARFGDGGGSSLPGE